MADRAKPGVEVEEREEDEEAREEEEEMRSRMKRKLVTRGQEMRLRLPLLPLLPLVAVVECWRLCLV